MSTGHQANLTLGKTLLINFFFTKCLKKGLKHLIASLGESSHGTIINVKFSLLSDTVCIFIENILLTTPDSVEIPLLSVPCEEIPCMWSNVSGPFSGNSEPSNFCKVVYQYSVLIKTRGKSQRQLGLSAFN